jgi:hypothetical protein
MWRKRNFLNNMRILNILDLYVGSGSFSNIAKEMGHNVFRVDWIDYGFTDLVMDIENLTPDMIPFIPDFVWDSRDCKTYSIAAISHHRRGHVAFSEYDKKCDRTNTHVGCLLEYWLKENPNMVYFIENPVGMMRKMPFMSKHDRATVTYCQYGDNRMKPTDIFSNHIYSMFNPHGWKPRQRCNNGDKCHEAAPRGSKTGTQGRKGSYERSRVPYELCKEILESVK